MYHWAGEFRKVNISKSDNAFLPIQSFDTAIIYLNHLIDRCHDCEILIGDDDDIYHLYMDGTVYGDKTN